MTVPGQITRTIHREPILALSAAFSILPPKMSRKAQTVECSMISRVGEDRSVRKHFPSYALVSSYGGWLVTTAISDSVQIRSQPFYCGAAKGEDIYQ